MCVHKQYIFRRTDIFLTRLQVTAVAYPNQAVQEDKCFSVQCA